MRALIGNGLELLLKSESNLLINDAMHRNIQSAAKDPFISSVFESINEAEDCRIHGPAIFQNKN